MNKGYQINEEQIEFNIKPIRNGYIVDNAYYATMAEILSSLCKNMDNSVSTKEFKLKVIINEY